MRFRGFGQVVAVAGLGALASSLGCKSKTSSAPPPAASSSASALAPVASAAPSSSAPPSDSSAPTPLPTSTVKVPEGPSLAIQAGRGVGPIRIGATVATINRLMEAPCDVQTPEVCRYIVRSVEFFLDKNGVTDRIVVQRHERYAGLDAQGKPQVYGFFNGGIPPGAGLGMVPKAVLEIIGKPLSSERVTEKNLNNTIVRDTYPGMVLEYDEYKNGKVMLGAVIITKDKK